MCQCSLAVVSEDLIMEHPRCSADVHRTSIFGSLCFSAHSDSCSILQVSIFLYHQSGLSDTIRDWSSSSCSENYKNRKCAAPE